VARTQWKVVNESEPDGSEMDTDRQKEEVLLQQVPEMNTLSEKVKTHKIFQNFAPKRKIVIAKE